MELGFHHVDEGTQSQKNVWLDRAPTAKGVGPQRPEFDLRSPISEHQRVRMTDRLGAEKPLTKNTLWEISQQAEDGGRERILGAKSQGLSAYRSLKHGSRPYHTAVLV
jgi:hypothetical protein